MRSRALVLLAALMLIVGLAACGSDSNDSAKGTTTTAGKTTTTAGASSSTTAGTASSTAGGSQTTTSISIPSEKPNKDFCAGFVAIDNAGSPQKSLAGVKAYYQKVQAAIEKMRDNAPAALKSHLSQGADLLDKANARIQSAKTLAALQKDTQLAKIFQTDLSLNDVQAYGTKYCK
jgi:hypothetical protein